ncbi:AzlD domain-containing protein [Stappia sp. F7233]|uniref:AzlD domain-containing protein n=1 Tax=Stappia albiluteola TaxID=2758565 RepID=A0A839AGD1_9HYPH|nr:AzlD domain-containing protein [Stappia albiluteola]MBA5777994.1 AzlD domain-containing protein [Stappia albiluteola]
MIIVAGWLATDIWRWLGVLVGGRLREDSEALMWVRAVATALVAGVISRLILFPTGALAGSPLGLRIAAASIGFVAFLLSRQKVVVGVLTAEVVLVVGWLAIGGVR